MDAKVSESDVVRAKRKSIIQYHTFISSTAQGGGGSFNNRKPIGELGCCESRMAKRSH